MEDWRRDARREPIIVDLDALVPKDHLLRKIEKVMDYEWLYERLAPYYCHDNGRPGTDPDELTSEIFEHILNKALNNKMLDPSAIFIDGTHIKASANKKKFQKEQGQRRQRPTPGSCAEKSTRKEKSWARSPLKMRTTKIIPKAVFADAKEKHAMRYTHHRGLAAVTRWVRLKFAAMNLKKLANWSWRNSFFRLAFANFSPKCKRTPRFRCAKAGGALTG